jgi:putative phosphoribosyl transferase
VGKEEIMEFADRMQAGRLLAKKLDEYANRSDVVVLALPRGGVPVGYEVARALNAPLDVFLVRKLGVPGHEEFAMGAIASGGVRVMNKYVVQSLDISDRVIDEIAANEQRELERRERLYRGSEKPLDLAGRIVIVVDDGLATGSTMTAAVEAIERMKPSEIVVAAPVASQDACAFFNALVGSTCVCFMSPQPFEAVGLWYRDFPQTTDAEVCYLLKNAKQRQRTHAA